MAVGGVVGTSVGLFFFSIIVIAFLKITDMHRAFHAKKPL